MRDMTQQHDNAQPKLRDRIAECMDFCAGVEGADGKALPSNGLREMRGALNTLRLMYITDLSESEPGLALMLTCRVCEMSSQREPLAHEGWCAVGHAQAILARYTWSAEPKPCPDAPRNNYEHEFPLWCWACGQALGDHDICYGCGTYYSWRVEPTPDELGPCVTCGQEPEEAALPE